MQQRLRIFYDNLERRIVVIMHTFKMYGHSSEHLGESQGSSPVTTLVRYTMSIFLHHLLQISDVGFIRCSTCWSVKIGTFLLCILINNIYGKE